MKYYCSVFSSVLVVSVLAGFTATPAKANPICNEISQVFYNKMYESHLAKLAYFFGFSFKEIELGIETLRVKDYLKSGDFHRELIEKVCLPENLVKLSFFLEEIDKDDVSFAINQMMIRYQIQASAISLTEKEQRVLKHLFVGKYLTNEKVKGMNDLLNDNVKVPIAYVERWMDERNSLSSLFFLRFVDWLEMKTQQSIAYIEMLLQYMGRTDVLEKLKKYQPQPPVYTYFPPVSVDSLPPMGGALSPASFTVQTAAPLPRNEAPVVVTPSAPSFSLAPTSTTPGILEIVKLMNDWDNSDESLKSQFGKNCDVNRLGSFMLMMGSQATRSLTAQMIATVESRVHIGEAVIEDWKNSGSFFGNFAASMESYIANNEVRSDLQGKGWIGRNKYASKDDNIVVGFWKRLLVEMGGARRSDSPEAASPSKGNTQVLGEELSREEKQVEVVRGPLRPLVSERGIVAIINLLNKSDTGQGSYVNYGNFLHQLRNEVKQDLALAICSLWKASARIGGAEMEQWSTTRGLGLFYNMMEKLYHVSYTHEGSTPELLQEIAIIQAEGLEGKDPSFSQNQNLTLGMLKLSLIRLRKAEIVNN